jgi:hypothetical protein
MSYIPVLNNSSENRIQMWVYMVNMKLHRIDVKKNAWKTVGRWALNEN